MPAIDLFAFLDGTSAWWWVAAALVLGAVEVVTFTYFMLWLALGALTVAGLLFVAPDTTGTVQILVFALATIAYAIAGWAWLRSRNAGDRVEGTSLNRRAAALIGRHAVVSGPFRGDVGQVTIDGVTWRARLEGDAGSPPGKGTVLEVTAAEGSTLAVRRRA